MEAMNKENERLLHELQESKSKERIYKFGLERFSSSSEDIKFYTGFPDYPTLIEFWKYVEPSANNMYLLTEWEGRTGKYLARGQGVRTERSEVRTS